MDIPGFIDRKPNVEKFANGAEIAARQNNSRELYEITRQLAGKKKSTSRTVRDKQGNLLAKESYNYNAGKNILKKCWKEHF